MDKDTILSKEPTRDNKANNIFEISIMSDTHLIPEDMIAYNDEYIKANKSDRKIFSASEGIFKSVLKMIDEKESDIILIPGDLSKDGELRSHKVISKYLNEWLNQDRDRRVFLVPGNHDINNHNAKDFNYKGTGKTVRAQITSPKDFIEIYRDLIYDRDDVKAYKDSDHFKNYLDGVNKAYPSRANDERYNYYGQGYCSYLARLDSKNCKKKGRDGLTIFALDSTVNSIEFSSNKKDGHNETYGVFTENLFSWILDEAQEAKKRKDAIIAIAHHPLVPSFDKEEYVLSPYILRNWNEKFKSEDPRINGKLPGQILAENNICYYFTGHLHANDISVHDFDESKLYNIQTGSTVTHPLPIRHVLIHNNIDTVAPSVKVEIESEFVSEFTYRDPESNEERFIDDAFKFTQIEIITADLIANYFEPMINNFISQGIDLKSLIGPIMDEGYGQRLVEFLDQRFLAEDINVKVLNGKADLTIKSDKIESVERYGPGDKISLDLEFLGMFREELMVRGQKLEETANNIIGQIEKKVIRPEHMYRSLYDFAQALLDTCIYSDKEVGPKTVSDLMNEAFRCFLRGSSTQKAWIEKVIYRYKDSDENIFLDALNGVKVREVANNIFDDIAQEIDYKISADLENSKDNTKDFLGNLLESDSKSDGLVYRTIINFFADLMGNSLFESLRSEKLMDLLSIENKDRIRLTDILDFLYESDLYAKRESRILETEQDIEKYAVEWLTGVKDTNINDVFISSMDSMTKEDFQYQYHENKNTIIIEMVL